MQITSILSNGRGSCALSLWNNLLELARYECTSVEVKCDGIALLTCEEDEDENERDSYKLYTEYYTKLNFLFHMIFLSVFPNRRRIR